jgi:hypothetical protein
MFNPKPARQIVPLHDGHVCLVFDDVLLDPQAWVDTAIEHRARFVEGAWNAYPGPELALASEVTDRLCDFFAQHARSALGARRTLRAHSRFALVTRPPETLAPCQRFCHRDRLSSEPGTLIAASVLYLFDKPELGGTSFYRPRRPRPEIDALVQDSVRLANDDFNARYPDIAPGYMRDANPWFEHTATVAPRYNRLIVYRGDLFHSGDIARPDLLSADPARGRLTVNGFFTCRAAAG